MFYGEYVHSLGPKNRLILPASFREQLSDGIFISRGLDGCLFVLPRADWDQFTKQLKEKLPFTQKSGRDLTRFFFAGSSPIDLDSQGRITIPEFLKEYAQLDSTVVISGVGTRIELWDAERWRETMQEVEPNVEQIAEQYSNITF